MVRPKIESYKKIWSLNPSLYEDITPEQLVERYCAYVKSHIETTATNYDLSQDVKSIAEWLETEI